MDRYDEAIEYFTQHPSEIISGWANVTFKHWCLFSFCNSDRRTRFAAQPKAYTKYCGCLTQVARGMSSAIDEALTLQIKLDRRVPTNPANITVADLPVFAEWQRKMDAMWPGRYEQITN